MRIVYMGTPDFAVAPLDALIEAGLNIVGVVTNPDKAAGRGRKIQESAVKVYAKEKGLKILQPEKFRDEEFLNELKALNADLQIVVAFKMLPKVVWDMPRLGTMNLHASLLPDYRGAAPLNWAIINGEKKTGVTTFLLKHEIDTGNIIKQESVEIKETDNVGDLHDKLMNVGADLLVASVKALESGNYKELEQEGLIEDEIKHAPKIFKDDCKLSWDKDLNNIYNLVRGLSPYPAAWTEFTSTRAKKIKLKIYTTEKEEEEHEFESGRLFSDNKSYLKVSCKGGYLVINELQISGKKRMKVRDFLLGFDISPYL
ncbi:methionyl-tRNA formyltransferase [Marinilabiliaceae bacterium JC040]|nr:methionyl-tRNA formyltransferase [Marinilabiliaceae bacterium JC040]